MSYPAPTSTDAKHNPYHTSTTTAHSDSPETTHEESSSGETPPKMVQKSTATHPVEASEPQIHPHHSLQQPSSESLKRCGSSLKKPKSSLIKIQPLRARAHHYPYLFQSTMCPLYPQIQRLESTQFCSMILKNYSAGKFQFEIFLKSHPNQYPRPKHRQHPNHTMTKNAQLS